MEPEKDMFEQWKEERESRPWYKKIWNSISIRWEHDWKYIPKETVRGLKSIWYWLPIIWKDRNWDSHYIFEILKHKLKTQADYISKMDRHTRAQHDARNMRICTELIQKIQDDFYELEHSDYHKTKHWFEPCEDKEGYSTWESRQLEENFDDYFAKYPLIHKRVLNGEGPFKPEGPEDKQRIAMNISHINHKRARKLLFNIMESQIEGWWD